MQGLYEKSNLFHSVSLAIYKSRDVFCLFTSMEHRIISHSSDLTFWSAFQLNAEKPRPKYSQKPIRRKETANEK